MNSGATPIETFVPNSLIFQERRRRFALLVSRYRGQREAADALGFGSTSAVSNYKLRKNMGERLARRLEQLADLPHGALTDPLRVPWPYADPSANSQSVTRKDELVDSLAGIVGHHLTDTVTGRLPVYVQSFEFWRGDVKTEIRYMTVPAQWLDAEGLNADDLKSMEMPDNSQADRIRKGDWIAVNTQWGSKLLSEHLYAVQIGGRYTLRRAAWQASGKLLLRCRNDDYVDEVVDAADVDALDVLGVFVRFQGVTA